MQNNAKHKMCDFIYAKISECGVYSQTHTHTHIKFPILPLCGFLSLCYGHKIEMENEMGETVKRFWCVVK